MWLDSLRRFAALGRLERWLVVEAFVALTFAIGALRLLPGRSLTRLLLKARVPAVGAVCDGSRGPRMPDPGSRPEALVLALDRAAARHPLHASCLARAIAGRWMLARRGHDAAIVVGARGSGFAAHAWLDVEGQPGRVERDNGFTTLWRSRT